MSKAKLVFLVEIEYEQSPDNYEKKDRTPEAMLAVDLVGANDDPFLFLDSPNAVWKITGEILR